LIAEYVGYVEFLKITEDGTFHRHYAIDHPSLPLKRNVSIPLQKEFDLSAAITLPQPTIPLTPHRIITPRIHIGSIVSGEKVMGDVHDPMQKKLLEPFDNSLAVDMESIGMARQDTREFSASKFRSQNDALWNRSQKDQFGLISGCRRASQGVPRRSGWCVSAI
jgi:hypothetical protein